MTTTDRAGLRREKMDVARQLDAELAALFEEHADFVWRVLKRLGTPSAELEDALQEVFLVVARKLPEYQERGSMRAWLFAIARQIAGHALRSTRRREQRERHPQQPRTEPDPLEALERSEAVRFVEHFLSQLDEPQAAVFHLSEIEGLSAPEIASCLGVGLNTVYSRLRLSRARFERALSRRGDRSQP